MHTCCWLKWAANVAEISSVVFLHFSTRCWTVGVFLLKTLYHSHVLHYVAAVYEWAFHTMDSANRMCATYILYVLICLVL